MAKLNNTVFFASNEGGHFAQLMALHDLFDKYNSVIVTDNKRANKDIPALKNVKAIEFAMAFAEKREELTKDKSKKLHMLAICRLIGGFLNSVMLSGRSIVRK